MRVLRDLFTQLTAIFWPIWALFPALSRSFNDDPQVNRFDM
jgi:hypothetical protein